MFGRASRRFNKRILSFISVFAFATSLLVSTTEFEKAFAQDLCATVAECAQEAMEAAYQAKIALQLAVPKGAVMAFNLKECPKGWTPLETLSGRVIVGAGAGDGLTQRDLGQKGGVETVKLAINQLPAHSHRLPTDGAQPGNNSQSIVNSGQRDEGISNRSGRTDRVGNNVAHENMPPFFVLKYCERK